jgi:hypothetical protein
LTLLELKDFINTIDEKFDNREVDKFYVYSKGIEVRFIFIKGNPTLGTVVQNLTKQY